MLYYLHLRANAICSHYYAQWDTMIVSHTFVSDRCYAAGGISETCDCILTFVSHTLLHTLVKKIHKFIEEKEVY
jgi:hypothetical protein